MSCSKLLSNSQKLMLCALRGIIRGVVLENMEKNIFKHLKITLPTNLLQFQNSGQIAPLDEIIKLKEKYRFRVILDESNSIGVIGNSGRGLTEHYKIPVDKVDIVSAAMGHALATEGGFCTGSASVIDHQVYTCLLKVHKEN